MLCVPAGQGDVDSGGAVFRDVDADGTVSAPSHEARELPERLHDQSDHLLVLEGMIDLDAGPARRKIHHAAIEVPGERLQSSMPEDSLASIFSALRH